MRLARGRQHRLIAPQTLYPGKGRGFEGVANFPDGPPADFATRPAGRQETEDATSPISERISSFWREKNFSPVKLEADRLEITFKDSLAKSEFMDWLEDSKRTSFSDERPPIEQPVLPGLGLVEGGSQ